MAAQAFTEGVRPGGLTTSTEIRILLCYILDNVGTPVRREQLEEVLLGEELANYFVMAESLSQLLGQGLIQESDGAFTTTEAGRTVARTLAEEVPRTVRDTAIRGVIRAQQYVAKAAAHQSQVVKTEHGRSVQCRIGDDAGPLFEMELYMPDDISAGAVRDTFVDKGDTVYELLLAALTDNRTMAEKALQKLRG